MTQALAAVCAALGDDTRWEILAVLGQGDASASALATRLPVSRQGISQHLAVLEKVGLVTSTRVGREVRYRAVGSELRAIAQHLDRIGTEWDRRLAALKEVAEGL